MYVICSSTNFLWKNRDFLLFAFDAIYLERAMVCVFAPLYSLCYLYVHNCNSIALCFKPQLHDKFWIFVLNFRLWEETSVNVWITAINKWRYYRCDTCFESVDGEV